MSGCLEVVVIGGGMAGAAAAYEIAAGADVRLIEAESQCGYHATGRSAASFTENYGSAIVRRLVMASRSFLESPPEGFSPYPILRPRGMITVAREDQISLLREELERAQVFVASIRPLGRAKALAMVPVLRTDYVANAIYEPHSMDVDVHALHQGYLRGFKARGGTLVTGAPVQALARRGGRWQVTVRGEAVAADLIVNAAGAWADEVAALAGLRPLGLAPMRRTVFTIDPPPDIQVDGWPLVNDVGAEFYFKADAGRLLVSPADATPSAPTDAQPEELDIAIGVERLQRATTLEVRRIGNKWAGLRTFARDGSPVVGFDPDDERFFWLAGQGGYGIKTAAALGRAVAGLLLEDDLPAALKERGLTEADLSPRRLKQPKQEEE